MKDLSGKTALVTGAGGAIGSAIVRRFCLQGARVIAVDISGSRLLALKDRLPEIITLEADVATRQGADDAVRLCGTNIDILSNNAGMADGGGSIDELDDATWERVLSVNLTSAFLLCRRVCDGMLVAKSGVILNMSSVAGLRGGRTGIAYTASKWALIGMTQNIASSLGPEGIRAYAICPAVVTGAMSLGVPLPTKRSVRNRGRDTGQPGPTTPEDVAHIVSFLCSDEARHLNGVTIPIDRGWLAY